MFDSKYKRCLLQVGRLMVKKRMKADQLTEGSLVGLLTSIDAPASVVRSPEFTAKRFIRFLADRGLVKLPPPRPEAIARAELRQDYETYLRQQRGLSERTIFHCWRFADRFLSFCFGEGMGDLSATTQEDIARFLQNITKNRQSPLRDRTPPTHLRNFFRYLFKVGKTSVNLAPVVPKIRQRRDTRLPRHLTTAQVEEVLEAVRLNEHTKVPRRNYALVLLLARLGLRAREVVAMRLDDIDWRSGDIIVRGKGNLHDRLPLQPDVGKALAEYLRFERPNAESRVLFVSTKAPHLPFKDGTVLNDILKDAFARAGLKAPTPYVGSHILRHSLACHMAKQGASLDEIGEVLRHRSRPTTLIYAKIDIESLRSIAQPWPITGGAQ